MFAILCIGDSITFGRGEVPTFGWPGRLKQYFEFEEFREVYNLGIPGDTSEKLKDRIDVELRNRVKYLREEDKFIIIISIGMNDTKGTNKADDYQIGKNIYRENLSYIIQTAKKHSKYIITLSQTPVDESLTMPIEEVKYYNNNKIEKYNEIIKEISKKESCLFCDINSYFKSKNYINLLQDGIHPNSKGYDEMFEFIKNFLLENKLI